MNAKIVIGVLSAFMFLGLGSGYVSIYGESTFLPDDDVVYEVCGWNEDRIDVKVYEIEYGILYEALQTGDEETMGAVFESDPIFEKTLYGGDCQYLTIPDLDIGTYMILADHDPDGKQDYRDSKLFFITELGMVTKRGKGTTLIHTLDLRSGKPIADVDLKLFSQEGLEGDYSTDSEGMLILETNNESETGIIAKNGASIALASSNFYRWFDEEEKTYVYTDRPVYRPDQEVYFKAILWKGDQDDYSARTKEVKVKIYDSKGNLIYEEEHKPTGMGTISGKMLLAEEPALGYYRIEIDEERYYGSGSFQVEEYRKPEYQVQIATEKDQYISGDEVIATISANYYFGAPVSDAQVEYSVRKSGWYAPCKGYYCYYYDSYDYWGGYGEDVASGTTATDKEGNVKISFKADNEYNANYFIEARVIDDSRREVLGSTTVTVAEGEFIFDIQTDRYSYARGDNIEIEVSSKDIEGNAKSAYGKLRIIKNDWNNGKEIILLEEEFETGPKGIYKYDFVPDESGYYTVSVEGKDSRGNNISGEEYIYVRDNTPTWATWESLEIVLDKQSYAPGDIAHVMINSPVSDFSAFVTVEGSDVYYYIAEYFEGTIGTLEIPIKEEYQPNVRLDVIVLRDKTSYQSSVEVIVPPLKKFLNIEIETDKNTYAPKEKANFVIKVSDIEGNPVESELSMSLVDESIYSIAQESIAEIGEYFYGRRWATVRSSYSWNYWNSGSRAIEDMAEESLAAGADANAKSAMAPSVAQSEVRKYFPDTAFWHAFIKTDKDGQAKVTIDMPDTLTTWRSTIRAIDSNFRVGQGQDKIITNKDLVARLTTPRFFTQEDIVTISAVVHNYREQDKEIRVSLITDESIELLDEPSTEILLGAGEDARIDWKVAITGCCKTNMTIEAISDDAVDAMQLIIPIIPYGVMEQETWTGKVSDSIKHNIIVPENSVYGATELSLILSPSLASAAFDALEYLTSYPYGCVEQTMSSFLPNVYVAQILKGMDLENKDLEKDLPDMVSSGLQKLYNMQHSDGGWGWWENDDTHPFMTAYVLYGLKRAEEAEFTVDNEVVESGLSSLAKQYNSDEIDANTKAYMLYVLSLHDIKVPDYPSEDELSDYGLALRALSALEAGEDALYEQTVNRLLENKICDESFCHWSSETFKYSWRNNDIETSSYVLMALLGDVEKHEDAVDKTARWLVSKRQGRRWQSTKDTATAVFALAEYMAAIKETNPDYTAMVYVNGNLAATQTKDDLFEASNEIKLEVSEGINEIRIEKNGEGNLYYSMMLRYFLEGEGGIDAQNSGIRVSRTYNNTRLESGEEVEVKLTIETDSATEYVILEDPIPAGCEVIEEDRGYYWGYWYSQRDVRDEKVAYFVTYLSEGRHEITYTLRAETPGVFNVMPATAYNMYDDRIRGHGSDDTITIGERVIASIVNISTDGTLEFVVLGVKTTDDPISGELVVSVLDGDGKVLEESKEYISIRESEITKQFSFPIVLGDGRYTIKYVLTTTEGAKIAGAKAITIGQIRQERKVDLGNQGYLGAILLILLVLFLAAIVVYRFKVGRD